VDRHHLNFCRDRCGSHQYLCGHARSGLTFIPVEPLLNKFPFLFVP
jgi:hypothetical protein